ncbi:MAG: GAF domain-containing protein [Nitrospirae bacterium]|nr:GAF domain-containing protein [Nitrospirota bacterium]
MNFIENKRKTILTLRWLLIIALSYLLIFQEKGSLFLIETKSRLIFDILVLLYIGSNVTLLFLPKKIFEHPWFDLLLILGDTFIVSSTMVLTHLSSSYFIFFYFLIVLMTTLGKGLSGIVTNGSVLIGVYVLFQTQEVGIEKLISDTGILLQIPFLLISVVFYGVLVDQEHRRYEKTLEQVRGVSEVICTTLNLREVYKTILDALVELLGAEKCSIMLLDKSKETLTIHDARGIPDDIIQTTRVKIGEGISGWVAEKGESLLLNRQTRVNPDGTKREPFPGIGSALTVPLKIQNRIIGVLNVASRSRKKKFTRQDLNILTLFASGAATAIENARLFEEIQTKGIELKAVHMDVVMAFAGSLESKDVYTGGHAQRLSLYAEMIAQNMQLEETKVEEIKFAAALHDVGKIAIPDRVLHETGKLDLEQWEIMRTHSEKGALMIAQIASLSHLSLYIRHHHERWDGNGYPDKIKAERIPIFSRIIAVCDTYDAVTTNRSYQKAYEPEEVIKILKACRGTQLDPGIVDIFLSLIFKNDGLLMFCGTPSGQISYGVEKKILRPIMVPLKTAA